MNIKYYNYETKWKYGYNGNENNYINDKYIFCFGG